MQLETIARTIQLILAPVVMVSACALLLNGLLSRYASIHDRLRQMAHDRLDLLRSGENPTSELNRQRLDDLNLQIPLVLRHHKLTQDAVLSVYLAVAIFIGDMFVIALGAVMYADWIGAAVLLVFLLGVGALLAGVLLTAQEIRTSHQAVQDEITRMAEPGNESD